MTTTDFTYYCSEAVLIDELDIDIDDPKDMAKLERDRKGCNCDIDDQCFNLACRERNRDVMNYYIGRPARRKTVEFCVYPECSCQGSEHEFANQ